MLDKNTIFIVGDVAMSRGQIVTTLNEYLELLGGWDRIDGLISDTDCRKYLYLIAEEDDEERCIALQQLVDDLLEPPEQLALPSD